MLRDKHLSSLPSLKLRIIDVALETAANSECNAGDRA
jgi:hypothetical protein